MVVNSMGIANGASWEIPLWVAVGGPSGGTAGRSREWVAFRRWVAEVGSRQVGGYKLGWRVLTELGVHHGNQPSIKTNNSLPEP